MVVVAAAFFCDNKALQAGIGWGKKASWEPLECVKSNGWEKRKKVCVNNNAHERNHEGELKILKSLGHFLRLLTFMEGTFLVHKDHFTLIWAQHEN